jgi:DNA-binding Lrp family transcriptional regulator
VAKYDYEVVTFKILSHLYVQMRNGEPIDENVIDAYHLKINEPYRIQVLQTLKDDGLITGLEVITDYSNDGNPYIENMADVRLTKNDIDYIRENKKMIKVFNMLKQTKEWVPGITALAKLLS